MTSYDVSDAHVPPKYAVSQFTVKQFYDFWPQLERTLDQVPHTWHRWTKESIYEGIIGDHIQVWGVGPPPNAVLVFMTKIQVYPRMKVLALTWSCGHFEPDMMPVFEAAMMNFAQLNGCAEIEMLGRPGFDSHMKGIGFKRTAFVWTQQVSNLSLN